MSTAALRRVVWKIFLLQQVGMLTALPPTVYMVILIMGLSGEVATKVALINLIAIPPVFGVLFPFAFFWHETRNALASNPHDAPGDRLKRILKLPRKIEVGLFASYGVAAVAYSTWPTMVYGLDPWITPLWVVAFLLIALMVFIRQTVWIERLLRPYALEEFHKHPQVRLQDRGLLWPKQRWYLPYCFALFVLCTLMVTGTIIGKKAQYGLGELFDKLAQVATPEVMAIVRNGVSEIMASMIWPLGLIGGFLVLSAAWTAWELVRHQSTGMEAVEESIESLVSGKPALPNWVSTDEVGELSSATATAFERLRNLSFSLRESAQMLGMSAEQLGDSHKQQTESLSIQAVSLQETQVTAQEIRQTSQVASEKAESVLKQAERAEQIGRAGEQSIAQSLQGMQDMQNQVLQVAESIRSLEVRTQQIANITATVKSLADKSNMLALNAAIEAVRSGEHGKGFAVVAREIRNLADQSIRATFSVRDVLEELSGSIRDTAALSELGSEKVRVSLNELQSIGGNIRQLSGIVSDNVSAVRQIFAAVTQQNTGISQIFQAVNDLTNVMDQTMGSLRMSDEAVAQMRTVAEQVNGFVEQSGWKSGEGQPSGDLRYLPKAGSRGPSGASLAAGGSGSKVANA